jgi:hypothetical protein
MRSQERAALVVKTVLMLALMEWSLRRKEP